MQLHENGDAP